MAKNDTVTRIGEEVYNNYLRFVPTSNSTKPPHIANGLFREVSGEICDFEDVHEWMSVTERKKIDPVSAEMIIEKYKDILWHGDKEDPMNVKEFRFILDEIFNPDHTVYPDYSMSAVNISSHWLVKKAVPAEARIGRFIFDILSKKKDGKRSPALDLIKEALEKDDDDLTKIVKPIIVFPSDAEKRDVRGVNYEVDEYIVWDACKDTIRQGFDHLTVNMKKIGDDKNSLLVLERMVNYACFATFYYLINVNAAQHNGNKPPILIDASNSMESIKKASEQCYSLAKTAVEDFYVESIDAILHEEITHNNKNACEEWIKNMNYSKENREQEIPGALNSYFDSFCADGDNPIHALAHALQIILYTFDYKDNSPSDFCRVLGVRSGVIGPKGNRAIKRYLLNSFTMETITYSILSEDDINNGIELKDLCKKATEYYNILFGADVDNEYRILENANIAQSTPGDLRGDMAVNAQYVADLYISLGMGHRYADGVTMIGRRY